MNEPSDEAWEAFMDMMHRIAERQALDLIKVHGSTAKAMAHLKNESIDETKSSA